MYLNIGERSLVDPKVERKLWDLTTHLLLF